MGRAAAVHGASAARPIAGMPRAFRLDHATNRKDHLIDPQRRPRGGRHQIGIAAGFGSEQVAGFRLECMAGFVGIRNMRRTKRIHNPATAAFPMRD